MHPATLGAMNLNATTIGHYVVVLTVIGTATVLAITGHISGSEALTIISLAGGVSIGSGVTLAGSGYSQPSATTTGVAKSPSVTPTNVVSS